MNYDNRFGLNFMLTSMVKRLLIANTAVFAVSLVLGDFMFDWFAFQPRQIVFRPWGPVTYMFLHGGLGHLAMNMLVLFFFGPPLEARWGEREFLRFYMVCGLGGAALSYVFLPNSIVGASAAVYGVMLAFAMNWPNMPIYVFGIFPVQAKYLVGFMALSTLLSAVGSASGSNVAHFAHLGGLIVGYLYLKADLGSGQMFAGLQRATTRKRRMAIVPNDESDDQRSERAPSRPSRAEDTALFDDVDAVLDKISASGMSSLTAEELELLDTVSRKHRTN